MFNSALTFVLLFSASGVIFYLVLVYLFPWLHRKRIGANEMPESWERILQERHEKFGGLSEAEKNQVRKIVKVFMAEKFLEPDDKLKWDEQILICSTIALKVFRDKHKFLSKLSTITIGKDERFGQGLLEVPSIEHLSTIEYMRWY